ncbi:FAD-dependent oxidoreductase [Oceanidesulfovibrio marinus]|uniref:FAD-dependent oxidoreductase n=1 Tax=Oceanidesulfovibrio marinus TaxID=370038 RepID=UPI0039A06A55
MVLGAGVNGCSIAYNLARRGLKTVICDKGRGLKPGFRTERRGGTPIPRDTREMPFAF